MRETVNSVFSDFATTLQGKMSMKWIYSIYLVRRLSVHSLVLLKFLHSIYLHVSAFVRGKGQGESQNMG